MRDEQKLMQQLDQLREQYVAESNPKSAIGQKRQETFTPNRGAEAYKGLTRTPDTISTRSKVRDQASRVSGDRSGRGSPTPMAQEPSYMQPPPSYQHPYHTPPVQVIYESPPNFSSNTGVNEQLERLKQVQDEIDRKNNEERSEMNKIVKEIMDTSRRYNFGSNHSSPRFGNKKYSELADPYNLHVNQ